MLLPFTEGLTRTWRCDPESALLSDAHYSRQSPGNREFMPPGRTLILRDNAGLVVFGWLSQEKRDDGQRGYNCSIFRNESTRRSSEIILEAERAVFAEWGPNRLFTYIDAEKTRTINRRGERVIGFCFQMAGWKMLRRKDGKPQRSTNGLYLLVKLHRRT